MNRLMLVTGMALGLMACTPTVSVHGNMLEDHQVKQIITGIHTRSDVLRILGSPTTQSPFNENIWYYLGQEKEKRGILDPDVTKETMYVVLFNEEGIVQSLNQVDPNRLDVPIEEAKTPTHGNDVTIMQQFLGNLGRFNPQEKESPTDLGRN